jgi:hypothetical protein
LKRLLILFAAVLSTGVQAAEDTDYALTIYSRAQPGAVDPALYRPGGRFQAGAVPGYATVRQAQPFDLEQGGSELRLQDVASLIDPTTVSITAAGDGDGVRVLEQNFEFDLVSSQKLLERYLDRLITVSRSTGSGTERVTGTLLSTDGGLVLRKPDGGVQIIREYRDVELPDLPGGLITRPTLVWRLTSETAGTRLMRVNYQTAGMTWWADYNATLDDSDGCSLDLNAWVSIVNQSGAGYPDSRLKLIAGDVQRISPVEPRIMMEMARAADSAEPAGFQEKSFFEYHLYTLPRRTSLPDNSTKQLELFPAAAGVPCARDYVHDTRGTRPEYGSRPYLDQSPGRQPGNDVAVHLSFRNDTESGLGMPLPAGRLRVNKRDTADDTLEFIGEDVIDHTPRNEELNIRLGSAFDIVVDRRQTDFRVDTGARTLSESFEIVIRNHKDSPVTVKLNETLYRWVNWDIIESSHEFHKLDARSVQFPVEVAADGEAVVGYEVRYDW